MFKPSRCSDRWLQRVDMNRLQRRGRGDLFRSVADKGTYLALKGLDNGSACLSTFYFASSSPFIFGGSPICQLTSKKTWVPLLILA